MQSFWINLQEQVVLLPVKLVVGLYLVLYALLRALMIGLNGLRARHDDTHTLLALQVQAPWEAWLFKVCVGRPVEQHQIFLRGPDGTSHSVLVLRVQPLRPRSRHV